MSAVPVASSSCQCDPSLPARRFAWTGGRNWRLGLSPAHVLGMLLLAMLAGCNPFPTRNSTPVVAYSPQVAISVPAEVPRVDWQLAVARPSAENMLSGTRIAVRERGAELQVLGGARWSDSVPELLQALVLRAFEDSGRILGVARQATALTADYSLALDLRAFEARYDDAGAPSVHVAFSAKLVGGNNRVLAARTFEARVQAGGREAPAVVQAFEAALSETLGELVAWTLTTPGSPSP